jgi:hypothetical protein
MMRRPTRMGPNARRRISLQTRASRPHPLRSWALLILIVAVMLAVSAWAGRA